MSTGTPFTDFSILRRVIATLGVNIDERTRDRLNILWKGEEIEDKGSLITNGDGGGLYEILPDGSVIRLIVHAPKGPSRHSRYGVDEYRLLNDPEMWHRFHIYWCRTLDSWSHRLRKTNRNDGKFTYPVFDTSGNQHKPELRDGGRALLLCKNCIQLMPGGVLPDGFSLEHFFSDGISSSNFIGIQEVSDFDQVPNVYPKDWMLISQNFKEMRSWRCEECFIDLSNSAHRRFLHAHHRDRRPNNCSITNLQALCIRCHASKHPHNSSLQQSIDLKEFNRLFAASNAG